MNGERTDGTMEEEMRASLVDGKLPCAQAFKMAKKFKVAPKNVGDAAEQNEDKNI